MTSVFNLVDAAALEEYLSIVESIVPIDKPKLKGLALDAVRYYKGDADVRSMQRAKQEIEGRWYASLDREDPDYDVYKDEFFLSEVWACWVVYSRKYLRAMLSETGTTNGSLVKQLDVKSVCDLGCGFGYTTAALKEMFPHASVLGTNVADSVQLQVAEKIGQLRDFRILDEPDGRADLVFASEYFEHFSEPTKHLIEVFIGCQPKHLVIANAFGATSVGHFREYGTHDGRVVPNHQIGRIFNQTLRDYGYEKVETRFWNARPAVWRLK